MIRWLMNKMFKPVSGPAWYTTDGEGHPLVLGPVLHRTSMRLNRFDNSASA